MQGPSGPFFMSDALGLLWQSSNPKPFPDSFNQCIGFYPESVDGSTVKHYPKRRNEYEDQRV